MDNTDLVTWYSSPRLGIMTTIAHIPALPIIAINRVMNRRVNE